MIAYWLPSPAFRQALSSTTDSGNTTTTQPTILPSPTSQAHSSISDHAGTIAGGVVGGVAATALAVVGTYFLRRKKGHSSQKKPSDTPEKHLHGMPRKTTTISEMHGNEIPPVQEKDSMSSQQIWHEMEVPRTTTELQGDMPLAK